METPRPEEGESNPDIRVLRRAKANFGHRDETIELQWQAGVFVPLHAPTGILASIGRRSCERVTLDLIDRTTAENQPVSSNSRAGNYAPRLFARRPSPEREGFKAADFETAIQALLSKGELNNVPYGRKDDLRYRLARPVPAAVSGG